MELRSEQQEEDREIIGIIRGSVDRSSPNPTATATTTTTTTRSDHRNPSPNYTTPVTVLPPHHHPTLDQHRRDPEPSPSPDPNPEPRYRECLKNHAASSGGHVLDGCGEFMPASADPASPAAMRCAACDCHRNFHRKEIEGRPEPARPHNPNYYTNNNNSKIERTGLLLRSSSSNPVLENYDPYNRHRVRHRHSVPHRGQPIMMAFGGAESSSDQEIQYEHDHDQDRAGGRSFPVCAKSKRFRTKFKPEQKDRMTELAERLGWRIQKHDEQEVQRFCSEVGIKRQVFKVWMHNNKQAMKKKVDGNNVSKPITREINNHQLN